VGNTLTKERQKPDDVLQVWNVRKIHNNIADRLCERWRELVVFHHIHQTGICLVFSPEEESTNNMPKKREEGRDGESEIAWVITERSLIRALIRALKSIEEH
jgi:hypothetical protein